MDKRCGRCKESKSVNQFGLDRRTFDGLKSSCKSCRAIDGKRLREELKTPGPRRDRYLRYLRDWQSKSREDRPEYHNALARKSREKRGKAVRSEEDWRSKTWCKFGLTQDEYGVMFESQGRRCAICRLEKEHPMTGTPGNRLGVDHCHKSGRIRALLCSRCNRGIGIFAEDSEALRAAADYLERHAHADLGQVVPDMRMGEGRFIRATSRRRSEMSIRALD
jgi:hypothetical protein